MPNNAVVGDGGGWLGVVGRSWLVGLSETASTDRSDAKFNVGGCKFSADDTAGSAVA